MKTDRHNFQIIANTMFRLLPVQIILAGLSSVNATVSGLFASNLIGADAMSAVALYDPIAKLLTAIATMLTGGAAILCGKYMGRNERDKMQGIFSLDMTLAAVISALIAVFLFIMGSFGLTGALTKDPVVAPHLHQYLIGQAAGVIPLLLGINSMGDVIKVAESVQAFCRARGMDEKTSYHAALAMEEMAGNIVDHGFTKDNKEHSIDIRVVHKEDDIILRMRDDCIPFNPGERLKLTDSENPVSNIGIRTIFAMARDVSYQSILGMNVLTIKV